MAESLNDIFASARKQRDDAFAAVDTQAATEAVADANQQSQRLSSALAGINSRRRETGGGRYGSIGQSRRGVRLSGLTSNLGAANRAALTSVRKKQAETEYMTSRRAGLMKSYGVGADDADKLASSTGRQSKVKIGSKDWTKVEKVDETGRMTTSWL